MRTIIYILGRINEKHCAKVCRFQAPSVKTFRFLEVYFSLYFHNEWCACAMVEVINAPESGYILNLRIVRPC